MNQFTWHLGSPLCIELSAQQNRLLHQTIPSYCVAIQRDVSVQNVAFDGREMRFLGLDNRPLDLHFVCKELGTTDFESIDLALKKECQRLASARVVTTQLAKQFNNELESLDARRLYPRLRIATSFVLEIEGGYCYVVNERMEIAQVAATVSETICSASELLDSFAHFTYTRTAQAQLALATSNENAFRATESGLELFVTDTVLYSKEITAKQGELYHFLQAHRCNPLCRLFDLSADKKDA